MSNHAYTHVPHQWPHDSTIWRRLWQRFTGKTERWLSGPIRVGERFIWEPDKPHAREEIIVTEVIWNGEEWWVQSQIPRLHGPRSYPNTSHRFREACIRA